MNPLEGTRLEKAAADCGFDRTPEFLDDAIVLRSSRFPESVAVHRLGGDVFVVSASGPGLLPGAEQTDTTDHRACEVNADGFATTCTVQGWNDLYQVLERAAAAARTLPDRVAQKFLQTTATLPKFTEAERWVVQRVGQDMFRGALLDYWRGRCSVTGLAVPELLRASHIKPWALCDTDEERLDVFNGLLLAPHLDALFDGGWMTVLHDGDLLFSKRLPALALQLLGVPEGLKVHGLTEAHQGYLGFHRKSVFR